MFAKKFKQAIPYFLLVMAISLLPTAPVPSASAGISVMTRLVDLENQKAIDVSKVRLETEKEGKELKRKALGTYEFKGSLAENQVETYDFAIETQEPYSRRTVKIKGEAFKKVNGKTFIFSLARSSGVEFTYAYLNKGLRYFDLNRFDNALAYYEIAYDTTGHSLMSEARTITMFAVKLAFNYAKALHNTCLYLNYDTCDMSDNLFKQLLALYDSGQYARIFRESKIVRENLVAPRNDLAIVVPNAKYSQINQLYGKGKFAESASLAAEALHDYESKPEVFKKIGLNKERLLKDAGVSYLKASEKAEKGSTSAEEVKALLVNAQKYLQEVPKPDSITKSNLHIVGEKLRTLE